MDPDLESATAGVPSYEIVAGIPARGQYASRIRMGTTLLDRHTDIVVASKVNRQLYMLDCSRIHYVSRKARNTACLIQVRGRGNGARVSQCPHRKRYQGILFT